MIVSSIFIKNNSNLYKEAKELSQYIKLIY